MFKLKRTDGLIKESPRVMWIEFDENDRFKNKFDKPTIGRSLLMSPFSSFFTWQTTPITEILEEKENFIRFKTKNSEYKLTYG